MASLPLHLPRRCSKCGDVKPESDYGVTQTVRGKPIKRAQCRACYNAHRRAHYSQPDVRATKLEKRRVYESIPEVAERITRAKQSPSYKEKAKESVRRSRAKPEIKQRQRERRREYNARPAAKALALLTSCRLRAQKKALPFDLTLDWISDRVIAGVCELTGLPFDFGSVPNGWTYNPRSPSVDQIIAGAGYKTSNCRVILTSLNNALSQYGDEHFEEVASAFLVMRGFTVTRP